MPEHNHHAKGEGEPLGLAGPGKAADPARSRSSECPRCGLPRKRGWIPVSPAELLTIFAIFAFAAGMVSAFRGQDAWFGLTFTYILVVVILGPMWVAAHRGDRSPRCLRCASTGPIPEVHPDSRAGPWAVVVAAAMLVPSMSFVVVMGNPVLVVIFVACFGGLFYGVFMWIYRALPWHRPHFKAPPPRNEFDRDG